MKNTLRIAAVSAISLSLATAVMVPAQAKDRWSYRSSGTDVSVGWLELGPLNGVPGNAHVGELKADVDRDQIWGYVKDWTCPEGELPPYGGGGHGEFTTEHDEKEETNCVFESLRKIDAGDADVEVAMDRKFTTASITGNLNVSDHDGQLGGRPPVDITLTGIGDTYSNTWYEKGSSGDESWVYKYVSSGRAATVEGNIGAMGFTDDADDQSSASMSTYKSWEKGSTR